MQLLDVTKFAPSLSPVCASSSLALSLCRHVWLHWVAFARPTNRFFHLFFFRSCCRTVLVDTPLQHSLSSGFGKACARVLEVWVSFHCGCGLLDQLFLLAWIFEVSWEFAELVYMCFVDLEKAFNRIPLGILWGIAGEYVVLGLSRLCTSVARAWSTLLVKYQIYSFCSSFLFAEFFFSEFAAEIEAAWLKISYKSKTTVLREGRSAHCDDLSKESRSDSALWTGLLYCGDTLTFRKSQLWKQRCCWSVYIHTLTYDQELWVMTKIMRWEQSWVQP